MIEFHNVSLSFEYFSLSVPSLCLPSKGSVLIEGSNGSGKSSLFRTLMKINSHYQGEIIFKNQNLCEFPTHSMGKYISYIPQISTDLPFITGQEFIQQGLYLGGENRLSELIEFFHMENLLKKSCHSMSGGEKQLCTIVRNLAIKKDVIIFDEADSFLSKKNKSLLQELVFSLSIDNLVLLSTHQHTFHDCDLQLEIQETSENSYQLQG